MLTNQISLIRSPGFYKRLLSQRPTDQSVSVPGKSMVRCMSSMTWPPLVDSDPGHPLVGQLLARLRAFWETRLIHDKKDLLISKDQPNRSFLELIPERLTEITVYWAPGTWLAHAEHGTGEPCRASISARARGWQCGGTVPARIFIFIFIFLKK